MKRSFPCTGLAVLFGLLVLAPGGDPVAAGGDSPTTKLKRDAQALAKIIDREIDDRLKAAGLKPSPLSDDAEFLRRVYLDLNGTIPPLEKVVAFLDSKDADKRARLIDELLADPAYGENLAETWMDRVFGKVGGRKPLDKEPLKQWLVKSFNANRPWNEQVKDMLTAAGPTRGSNPVGAPAAWLSPTARELTERANLVARVFLGRGEIKCAQCHNHPFTSYRKRHYWGFARLFAQVKQRFPGVLLDDLRPLTDKDVDEGMLVPPTFLDGSEVVLSSAEIPYRQVLAEWATSPQNPYFARAKVNWMWACFFGRGFTEVYDEMSEESPVSHPELLQTLADQFVANGFDVRYLIRAICNSQTYQRTSKACSGNENDRELFSHRYIQMLKPQQLLYSWGTLSGSTSHRNSNDRGRRKILALVGSFAALDSVDGELPDYTTYERNLSDQAKFIDAMTASWADSLAKRLVGSEETPEQNVQRLYLAILSRRPTAQELADMVGHVQKIGVREAYPDIAWVLLNSTEFASNH